MKKKMIAFMTAAAMLATCQGLAIAKTVDTVTAELSPQLTIIVDGVQRDFYTADGYEAHPIMYNGTTYLPLRAIGELMDKNVNWDEATLTVTLSGTRDDSVVTGTPDTDAVWQYVTADIRYDFTIIVDGAVQTFYDANGQTVYPMLYNGSTYLPIRAISVLMGKAVGWDGDTETVYIGTAEGTTVTDADTFNTTTVTDADTFAAATAAPSGTTSYTADITVDEAKAIALAAAGAGEAEAIFTKAKLDYDHGVLEYEIEFYVGTTEYDYDINASTGEIISQDIDYNKTAATTATDTNITLNAAKAIALNAAGVDESAATFTKAKLDYDDGAAEYDIEFYVDGTKYEYEINAATGAIISQDVEYNKTAAATTTDTVITADEAKAIVLNHAGLTEAEVTFTKTKLDYEDGIKVYEVEFKNGRTEYEYEINAATGEIVSFDVDND